MSPWAAHRPHPMPMPGAHDLVCDGDSLVLVRRGMAPTPVEGVLRSRLRQRVADAVLCAEDGENETLRPVPPNDLQDKALYKQVVIDSVRYKLKVYLSAWVFPGAWWEVRLLAGVWGLAPKTFIANMMKNYWKRWSVVLEGLCLPLQLCLRKGIDRQGKDLYYMRSLPEHSLSTMGLLVITSWRFCSSRGDGTRAQAAAFLSSFLSIFFDGEDVELLIDADSSIDCRPGSVPSSASVGVPIDDGRVFLKPLMEALKDRAHRFHETMIAEEFVSQQENGMIPLHEFLLSVFVFRERWLLTQVFGQVASFVDVLMSEKGFCDCPLSVEEDSPSLPKHVRRDRQLVHKLALGEGAGSTGERAWQQGSFVRAFELLSPPAKRMRTLTPMELNEDLMLKVLQAGQGILKTARHVCVALDGTRLGNKDVNFLAIGGFAADQRFRMMWAPVMVLLWGLVRRGLRELNPWAWKAYTI